MTLPRWVLCKTNGLMRHSWCGRLLPCCWYIGWAMYLAIAKNFMGPILLQIALVMYRIVILLNNNMTGYYHYPMIMLCVDFFSVSLYWESKSVGIGISFAQWLGCSAWDTLCSYYEYRRTIPPEAGDIMNLGYRPRRWSRARVQQKHRVAIIVPSVPDEPEEPVLPSAPPEEAILPSAPPEEAILPSAPPPPDDDDEEDGGCVICMENDRPVYPLKRCGHLFCTRCILRWAFESDACPLCRGPIR